jgi:hypothetical protein
MTAALETRGFGQAVARTDRIPLDAWDWLVLASAVGANAAALTARIGGI